MTMIAYEWNMNGTDTWFFMIIMICNHGGRNAILENAHHKNDNKYNIEMTIVTYNECINVNILKQSRTIVHNHNGKNNY